MIVSDTSPVISLARIGKLILLQQLFGEIAIPSAVEIELTQHPAGFGGLRPPWIQTHTIRDSAAAGAFRPPLGPGEAEAIVLARELNTRLLIDEEPGRRLATSLGLEMIGTLGALLEAKRLGLVPVLGPILVELRGVGFRVSDALIADIVRASGE